MSYTIRTSLLLAAAVLMAFLAGQSLAHADTCNQGTYDQVYKAIIMQALNADFSPEMFEERNSTIELLRKLCNGQMSTYEMDAHQRAITIAMRSKHND